MIHSIGTEPGRSMTLSTIRAGYALQERIMTMTIDPGKRQRQPEKVEAPW